ncbi:MAG: arginine--tRNA ligase, partial [Syntrophales bacterium]|nr:arginine--tRNA ligase [Syntrophales bacterium]
MKRTIAALLEKALTAARKDGLIPAEMPLSLEVEETREESHGDYASNVAMVMASRLRRNPREIAGLIRERLDDDGRILDKVEIAGPGFLNFFIREAVWSEYLAAVEAEGDRYGTTHIGAGRKVQVEFVSANPTGPLHIGHARGAVVGDVIANILAAVGYT